MESKNKEYLECEKLWIFGVLMLAGGFLGAFTYSIRGGVFCNAQTGNFVLLAMALGNKDWSRAAYYLIPMTAYGAGAVLSEILPKPVKRKHIIRWDTLLIGVEILVIFALGFLPESAPYQISQIAINFICSMQYNTFRQAQGIPMATTFCTNHLRQLGIHIGKWLQKKGGSALRRGGYHLMMLGAFVVGGVAATVLCRLFLGKAIWGAALILLVAFVDLLHADLTKERGRLEQTPSGH